MLPSLVIVATHSRRSASAPPHLGGLGALRVEIPLPDYLLKSFSCNTYGSPRKCCKQKTYTLAKPFRCNTYKKPGGRGRGISLTSHPSAQYPPCFAERVLNVPTLQPANLQTFGSLLGDPFIFLTSLSPYLPTSLLPCFVAS